MGLCERARLEPVVAGRRIGPSVLGGSGKAACDNVRENNDRDGSVVVVETVWVFGGVELIQCSTYATKA